MTREQLGYLEVQYNTTHLRILEELENVIRSRCRQFRGARLQHGYCVEGIAHTFTVDLFTDCDIDAVAEAVAEAITAMDKHEDDFCVFVKTLFVKNEKAKYVLRVIPNRDPDWISRSDIRKLPQRKKLKGLFPKEIAHVEAIVAQYKPTMIGGLDPLFPQDSVLEAFFSSLTKKQQSELKELRQAMYDQALHTWILDWSTRIPIDEENPEKDIQDDCLQFLAFLDRLSESELVEPPFELMDWDKIAEWEAV